jgi:ribonuclease BN (tRNA processing enzyme)
MKLQILGCAGGMGGREKWTTCLLLDHDVLLDAGTGLCQMDLAQLLQIDHIFISHSHLDHVVGLAFLLDTVLGERSTPVTVHASPGVIAILKAHLFNWSLWPDFSVIPDKENPILKWAPMPVDSTVELNGRRIKSYAVSHTVEAVAYGVRKDESGFLFSGDMASSPDLWKQLANQGCDTVIVDCSFPDAQADIANLSKHFCPQALVADIAPMPYSTRFLITHLKPGQEENIMQELTRHDEKRLFQSLKKGDVFLF